MPEYSEIVRCENCMYYEFGQDGYGVCECMGGPTYAQIVDQYYYCADGESKGAKN